MDRMLYVELKNKIRENGAVVYYPHNINEIWKIFRSAGLEKLKKPNLVVAGISPQCGKFTTQLRIKQVLQNEGYKVGWISTEPQGELFGANCFFPFGFEKSEFILEIWPVILHSLLFGIEKIIEPDIIISGHQSGLVPESRKFSIKENLDSLHYIASVRPDAVVCSVNPAYDLDFINRMVVTIRTIFQIPILFFTLSKKKIIPTKTETGGIYFKNEMLNGEEWQKKADLIQNKYNLPVLDALDEKYNQKIINSISNYFG